MQALAGVLLLAAAVGAAWLLKREGGRADLPLDGAYGVAVAPVDATGVPTGSGANVKAHRDAQDQRNLERIKSYSAIGGVIGSVVPVAGTAVGAAVGAWVGYTIQFWSGKSTVYNGPFGNPFDWHGTEVVQGDAGPAVRLSVPAPNSDTRYVYFGESALRSEFPGEGAYEACFKSGMFQWRPFDQPTPFSRLLGDLVDVAPNGTVREHIGDTLRAYADAHIRTTPNDYIHGGYRYEWWDLLKGDTENDFRRHIVLMRRAYAHHAIAWRLAGSSDPLATYWWRYLQKTEEVKGEAARDELQRKLTLFAINTGEGIWAAVERGGKSRVDYLVRPNLALFNLVNRGFSGAWRLTDMPPLVASSTSPIRSGVTRAAVNALRGTAPAPREPAKDGHNAFAFQVWLPLPWGETTVTSYDFADLFGTHEATRRALEGGGLAWSPKLPGPTLERWEQRFRGLEAHRPFHKELG